MNIPTLLNPDNADLLQTKSHQSPTFKTMARWYCQLNLGEWPDDIAHPGPANWLNLSAAEKLALPEVVEILQTIESRVEKKQLAKVWHTEFDPEADKRMTEIEFYGWWSDVGWMNYRSTGRAPMAA